MRVKHEGPTLSQVARQVLAELTGPAPVNVITEHIVARYSPQSPATSKRARDILRSYEMVGVDLVYLDPKTIIPLHLAMRGVCFRVPLGREEIKRGLLAIEPLFYPFLLNRADHTVAHEGLELRDVSDQIIPTQLVSIPEKIESLFGREVVRQRPALDLHDWLHVHRARPRDSIRVTILQWRPAHLRLEFEPHSQYRRDAIASENRALADCIQTLLDESYREQIYTYPAILTAYARMPGAHDYPGDHWSTVLLKDARFWVTDFQIKPGEGISTIDFLRAHIFDEPELKQRPVTREEGNRVYRFAAKANYGKKKCAVELLGRQTLGDFDDIMRAAFELDVWDHLSEFTRIARRGKGKLPHEQQYGVINPFEPTPAMELRLAGFDWQVGTELEYRYDFGDNLRHTVLLESIGKRERGVKYPHFAETR